MNDDYRLFGKLVRSKLVKVKTSLFAKFINQKKIVNKFLPPG